MSFYLSVLSLSDYIVRTAPLHHTDAFQMFIQLKKLHKSVSAQTLAWWMINIMAATEVDISMFKQHSTRIVLAVWLEKGTNTMSVA